ncbi:uncharacterized protein E0L32_012059 [Thyridium curvatum]|uniref:SH3 domain-containing protein n=1 Tax=Thyridium curvatum TaxID=1093900 RepID=A0A507BLT1_9PEZI|nr:uncharacterized protein E0L32_012059 [Thyridium curvatum]TPX17648.1 hypothetical protein E0L32_012059 [Thyridium curvatum]
MTPAPPPLPTRFPCWCRAVYSWGGESKRDLGFIEGDLIECLNAGDGSWWTGRLRRDRRMVGVFPSNFVEILPDSFRPMSRSTSPLPPNSNTPSPKNTPQKSKTFRKPFEAYAKAPHYTTAKQPETFKPGSARSRENSGNTFPTVHEDAGRPPTPPQKHGYGSRAPSPAPQMHSYGSRVPSPAPPMHNYVSRAPSPAPPPAHSYGSRAPSPAPSFSYQQKEYKPYRPPSPLPPQHAQISEPLDSPPPPAPPPHRHVVPRHGSHNSFDSPAINGLQRHGSNMSYENRQPAGLERHGSNLSYDNRQHAGLERHGSNMSYNHQPAGYHTPRAPSPCPPSPAADGLTPSPLREAMDGVIEQLDILGVGETDTAEPAFDPWSPESFDMVHQQSRRKQRKEHNRPQTSMGIAPPVDEGYETYSGSGSSSRDATYHTGYREDEQQLPQLSNYVERMETRLRNMHQHSANVGIDEAPPPPPKSHLYDRPKSSMGGEMASEHRLRHKRSAYEVGRQMLGRTFTTKTTSTSASSGNRSTTTQSTDRSLMSGVSASGISATSAGSLARKNRARAQSALGMHELDMDRPETPFTGVTYHSSHASGDSRSKSQIGFHDDIGGMGGMVGIGGLRAPKPKKSGFFKKILESAKTGVASTRGSIATAGAGSVSSSPMARSMGTGISSIGGMGPPPPRDAAHEMGLGNGIDWVQVRRDVNRSNSLSRIERNERRERCQMMDYPTLDPVDELYDTINGDEGADGMPVDQPIDYLAINLSQVDKNSRFISSLPPMTTAITLATTYVCRPYRSDVQRLRAIFTWVSEKITWEEEFEGEIDTRRVIQTKRACAEEYALLVMEMCSAVGLHCEIVRGYLKTPGEIPEYNLVPRSNHWWNAVLVDNEWRIMDCCLASPSNPRRGLYSSAGSGMADPWWFLVRPTESCWTHIPEHHTQQHICPPVAHEILVNLPCACPPYFKNGLQMHGYNTSVTRIEDLEMVHVKFNVPADVEVVAEVEVRGYSRDADGDFFESGEVVRKRALAQAEWYGGVKRYTVKALLPGDEGTGVLKVYAGTRGLMHSIKDIPHPLAFVLPVIHTGENPPYEFVTRHPTPHAQRHDIYVVQPQCQRLALNNTFVFAIRQHPSSSGSGSAMTPSSNPGGASPIPFARPGSAMSMTSSSAAGSNPSTTNSSGAYVSGKKPAKLAIQTPGGKILRLMRKEERRTGGGVGVGVGAAGGGRAAAAGGDEEQSDGGTWETIIKCSERGVWRGLVLADRTARWCVFAEWVCN